MRSPATLVQHQGIVFVANAASASCAQQPVTRYQGLGCARSKIALGSCASCQLCQCSLRSCAGCPGVAKASKAELFQPVTRGSRPRLRCAVSPSHVAARAKGGGMPEASVRARLLVSNSSTTLELRVCASRASESAQLGAWCSRQDSGV